MELAKKYGHFSSLWLGKYTFVYCLHVQGQALHHLFAQVLSGSPGCHSLWLQRGRAERMMKQELSGLETALTKFSPGIYSGKWRHFHLGIFEDQIGPVDVPEISFSFRWTNAWGPTVSVLSWGHHCSSLKYHHHSPSSIRFC